VEQKLRQLGLSPFRPAPTSVAVLVGTEGSRPAVGFRADLDALPVHETTGASYASERPGWAHACGHDGHAAILLGLARRLAAVELQRSVLLVWQQAEEVYPSGAPLVLQGLPNNVRPTEIFAFHLWPELPTGKLGINDGPILASVAGVTILIEGHRGRLHGTRCDDGAVDALAAGADLYRRIRRRWASRHPTLKHPFTIRIGQLSGGEAPNRPADSCVLRGTIRGSTWEAESRAIEELQALVGSIEKATVQLTIQSGIRPPVVNDADSVQHVRAAAKRAGVVIVKCPAKTVGVSDDFGWYLRDTPGALILVGCGGQTACADLHDPAFDFDEAALLPAIDVAFYMIQGGADARPGSRRDGTDSSAIGDARRKTNALRGK
jgi:amidohydrolase